MSKLCIALLAPVLLKAAEFKVADYGAVGDGVHDDGPAIMQAFAAAKTDGIPSSVVFENNTITPDMRNALLARAQNMAIERNTLDCSRDGVLGLNLNFASGQDGARLRKVRVAGNTFHCPDNVGLVAWRPDRDRNGAPDTRDMAIINNVFHVDSAKAMRGSESRGLTVQANRFLKDGQAVPEPSTFKDIVGRRGTGVSRMRH